MKYYAYCAKIKTEMKEEYKIAHDNIWPDYVKAVMDAGILNISIFYRKDGTLFLYFESDDPEKSLKTISGNPLDIKWQKEMEKFFIKGDTESEKDILLGRFMPDDLSLELIYHHA